MIRIFEDKANKLSGLKSLYLFFDYNVDVVNIIKSSETYFFHTNNHLWEVPITSLSYLLDNLCYIDDIDLIVEDDETMDTFDNLNIFNITSDWIKDLYNELTKSQ